MWHDLHRASGGLVWGDGVGVGVARGDGEGEVARGKVGDE